MRSLKNKKSFLGAICITLPLVVLFNLSMNWIAPGVNWHKAFVFFISMFGILGVPFLTLKISWLQKLVEAIVDWFEGRYVYMKENKRTIAKYAGVLLALVLVALVICVVVYGHMSQPFFIRKCIYVVSLELILAFLFYYRKNCYEKIAEIFVLVALILGMMTIFVMPREIGVVQDDDTHYIRTVSLVSVFDYVKYDTDKHMSQNYEMYVNQYRNGDFSGEKIKEQEEDIAALYGRENAVYENIFDIVNYKSYKTLLGSYDVAYIAPAVAMILAKGLHLPFALVFFAGKLGFLLVYVITVFFAIKTLKYGKLLMAALALSPTILFFSGNYSYDSWVMAFTLLSYSYFLRVFQDDEAKVDVALLVKMWGFLLLAVIPKMPYILLGIPFLFIPAKRFSNPRLCQWYRIIFWSGFLLGIVGVWYYITHGGMGAGDLRGGEGISPGWQLLVICASPMDYVVKLLSFLRQYVSPGQMNGTLCAFGYVGIGKFGVFYLGMLYVLALLDRKEQPVKYGGIRVVSLATVFLTLCAVATIFYLIYTPVGFGTVLGCQQRYMYPLLFGALYFLGFDGWLSKFISNKNRMATLVFLLCAVIYCYNFNYVFLMNL